MRRIDGFLITYSRAIDLKRNIFFIKEIQWNNIHFLKHYILYGFIHTSIGTRNVSAFTNNNEKLLCMYYFKKLSSCFMWTTFWSMTLCQFHQVDWKEIEVTTYYSRNRYSRKSHRCDEMYRWFFCYVVRYPLCSPWDHRKWEYNKLIFCLI